jgi:dTDP-4-dehydrorhamnose 3,5-epimerase
MDIKTTKLPGVLMLTPRRFEDARGYFFEPYNAEAFRANGISLDLVQENQSFSIRANTIRGFHFQLPPATQTKLVRVVRGSILDVVVDLRLDSPTYGQWLAAQLSAENGTQIFVPHGLAHGFCTLEPNSEIVYKVDSHYEPALENGIIWNDPTLNIPWPVAAREAIISDKDRKLGTFRNFISPFRYDRSKPWLAAS